MATTQTHRPFAIDTPLGEDVLLFRSMSLTEELGRPFRAVVELLSEDDTVDLDAVVGQRVTVRLHTTRGGERFLNGVVSRFSQVERLGRLARYEAIVVPWLWLLTRTADCRIFQDKTVPEIIKAIFAESALGDFDDRLGPGRYRKWRNCVQYRETDFAFVSRLMEHEGIYYFFEHVDGNHTLVLADGSTDHEAFTGYEEISHRPDWESSTDIEHLRTWRVSREVKPGSVALNAFDFRNPSKVLGTSSGIERSHSQAGFEVYDYPGKYREFGDGETYARVRIEEFHARHEVSRGESDLRGICTGYTFKLTDHARSDFCREYLITSAVVEAENDEYSSTGEPRGRGPICTTTFTAMRSDEQFRPARTTAKPVVPGPQTAIVVGREGDEIFTDKYGRVKVQFHWDRYGGANETSSCWIRVAQTWAGKRWGAIRIPRVGQEVIVEFLEGDPDRPIITGRVYNGSAMPPYTLPAHKTMSTVKTNSSKGGQGFNEIRFEDAKGSEQLFIHAERNEDIRVKASCFETIGGSRHLIVGGDQREHIEGSRHEIVDVHHYEEIGADRNLTVGGKQAVKVNGSYSLFTEGNMVEECHAERLDWTASKHSMDAMVIVINGKTGITLTSGGSFINVSPAGVDIQGPLVKINSGGAPDACGDMSAVSPAIPDKAIAADTADPGEVDEIKRAAAEQAKAHKPDDTKTSWIEIELVDEAGRPVVGEPIEAITPDGSVARGTTDENGLARIDGIDPGSCTFSFTDLDEEAWK